MERCNPQKTSYLVVAQNYMQQRVIKIAYNREPFKDVKKSEEMCCFWKYSQRATAQI